MTLRARPVEILLHVHPRVHLRYLLLCLRHCLLRYRLELQQHNQRMVPPGFLVVVLAASRHNYLLGFRLSNRAASPLNSRAVNRLLCQLIFLRPVRQGNRLLGRQVHPQDNRVNNRLVAPPRLRQRNQQCSRQVSQLKIRLLHLALCLPHGRQGSLVEFLLDSRRVDQRHVLRLNLAVSLLLFHQMNRALFQVGIQVVTQPSYRLGYLRENLRLHQQVVLCHDISFCRAPNCAIDRVSNGTTEFET